MPEGSEEHMHDLNTREVVLLLPLLILVFVLGIKPGLLMDSLADVAAIIAPVTDGMK